MARPKRDIILEQDGRLWITVATAARLCNVSKQTLKTWHEKPNPPPYNRDLERYDFDEMGEWIRTEQIYKTGRGGVFPYKPDMSRYGEKKPEKPKPTLPGVKPKLEDVVKEDQEERVRRLRGDKLEMELQERAGQLVNADDVLIAMTSMASRVKTRLLSIPSALATVIVGKTDRVEIQKIIEDKIRAALEELSNDPAREMENIDAE